jgi:hypothetical protein
VTEEFKTLTNELESAFFEYAQITGALEFYMLVLENPSLQRVVSKTISGSEMEWKQIHRFHVIDGQEITWYPELPVQKILAEKKALLGYLYGITLSSMIGVIDFYLSSVLKNHFGYVVTGGSSWAPFIQKSKVDLLTRKHGDFVYKLLQERHKIEHNKAKIDRKFLENMSKHGVQHTYKEGDSIQKSHMDVLLARQVILEFAEDVDAKVI